MHRPRAAIVTTMAFTVAACAGQPLINRPPDDYERYVRRDDGTCWRDFVEHCPPGDSCNPPPPGEIVCPPELAKPFDEIRRSGDSTCILERASECNPGAPCTTYEPSPIVCPELVVPSRP